MSLISLRIRTRTSVERLITDLNLYQQERRHMLIAGLATQMRNDISLTVGTPKDSDRSVTIDVRFRAPSALAARRVTDRLAELFVETSQEERDLTAQQTLAFLGAEAARIERRLKDNQATLATWDQQGPLPRPNDLLADRQALQESYRSILHKHEDAKMALSMEERHIGELAMVISGGSLPETPVGPAVLPFLVWGAFGGLATSLLLMLLSSMWRHRTLSEPQP
jgi:uncharacterized protein involved in exopolysaccharide biosynthesis